MVIRLGRARRALLLCSAIGGLGIGTPALAQEDQSTTLPELVITAERRAENLQEVSIAATVLNGEQLAERSITQIHDLQRVAPSLAINTYNRSTFVNIRGIGIAASAPTSTPGVAYYINGALIPHEQAIAQSFYDLDSVQVLRGPQGTLTGQNSTGGAIYVTTPKPKMDELSGYIDLTATEFGGLKAVAAVNVGITSYLAARIAGVSDQRDSFTTNIGGPSQPGDINLTAWRADVLFQPIEQWQTNFRYEKYLNDTSYNAIKRRNDIVSTNPFVIQEDGVSNFFQDGYRSEIESRFDLTDWLQVRGDVNYQYALNRDIADGDRTNTAPSTAPGAGRGRLGYTQTIFNSLISEIDFIGENGPVQWVAGGFYLTETIPLVLFTYGNSRVIPDTPPTSTTRTKAHNLSRSVFGQANWTLNEQWEFILGARMSKDTQIYERMVPAAATGVARSDVTTGRAAINYNFNETTMVYGSYAKGYKAGGVNLVAGDAPFKPETNTVEEIGFKTTVMDGTLRINGAAFLSQYEDLQLSSLTPARLPTTANVAESSSSGGELEVEYLWGPARFNFGGAVLSAETDVDSQLNNNTSIGAPGLTPVPAGSRLPFSPEVTLNAGIEADFELLGGTVTPRLQVSHLSEQWSSVFHNVNTLIPERTVMDARLTYKSGGAWRAELFANNLLDETYIASQILDSSSANGGILYGAPRVIGVRFVVRAD